VLGGFEAGYNLQLGYFVVGGETDRPALGRSSGLRASRRRLRPVAEIAGVEVSRRFPLSPAGDWQKPDTDEGYQASPRAGNAIVRLPNIHLDIRGATVDEIERIERRLKLHNVRVLMSVVEAGSMHKAAERLASSQPAVSRAIADLEQALGVRLLDRSPSGIEPTQYGRAIIKRGLAAFDELRQGVKEIEFLSDPTAGEVRMAGTPPMVLGLLPVVIDRLRRQHPRLSFQVTETSSGPAFYDQLRQRAIDFIIGRLPIRKLEKDLNGEIVFEDSICVVAGTRNRWASRRKIQLADLIEEPWILPLPDTVPGALVADMFHACGLDVPRAAVVTVCLQTTNVLLATGKFFAPLPRSIFRFSGARLSFKVLPIQLMATDGPVAIVTLRNRTLSPAALLAIDCIREVARPLAKSK
jgi:DNA-binding transcriptional LysR family regulator